MCFTVNSESVSHAGVICQFQSVASEIQCYNTCNDTVCTRTVHVFVLHIYIHVFITGEVVRVLLQSTAVDCMEGGGSGDTVCHTSMLPQQQELRR